MKNSQLEQKQVVEWTPEQVEELKKCIHDPIYFAENYFVIRTLDEGNVKIKLYDWQKEAIQQYLENRHNIYCVARQLGKTTLLCILALWKSIFSSDQSINIASLKEDQARNVMTIFQRALQNLPDFIKPTVHRFTKELVSFSNGSYFMSIPTDPVAFRGRAVNHLFIDDYGYINGDKGKDFFNCIIPVISSSKRSKITIASSASDKSHKFYQLLTASLNGENSNWAASVYNWTAVPSRNEEWKKSMQEALSDQIIWEKEFENVFID